MRTGVTDAAGIARYVGGPHRKSRALGTMIAVSFLSTDRGTIPEDTLIQSQPAFSRRAARRLEIAW